MKVHIIWEYPRSETLRFRRALNKSTISPVAKLNIINLKHFLVKRNKDRTLNCTKKELLSHVIWQNTLGERQERAGLFTELSPELRNLSKLEKKKMSESINSNIKAESEQRNDAEEYIMVVIQFG